MVLGENIQHLRKRQGYTQHQLAELVGVHPNYISQIERCEKEPSIKVLTRLRAMLSANWNDLLDPVDQPGQVSSGNGHKRDIELRKVQQFLERLDTRELKVVLDTIRLLARKKVTAE